MGVYGTLQSIQNLLPGQNQDKGHVGTSVISLKGSRTIEKERNSSLGNIVEHVVDNS